jgi:hypothetical protein
VVVGALSIFILKKLNLRSSDGQQISFPFKPFNKATIIGGTLFGIGWALTGACPGPIFALVGNGYTVFICTLAFAVAGAWLYGVLRDKLPH